MASHEPVIKTINRGAIIQSFPVEGQNIVLSFPHSSLYATHPHPYLGETIGRTANRIADAKLTNLNGRTYKLHANNGPNNLHGGKIGWGARDWSGPVFARSGRWDSGIVAVKPSGWSDEEAQGEGREGWRYSLTSDDGEEGFPGSLIAHVSYFEGRGPNGEVVLEAEYDVRWQENVSGDAKETVVSMTNHSYFNLNLSQQKPATLALHTVALASSKSLSLIPNSFGVPDGYLRRHPEVPEKPFVPFTLVTETGLRPIDDCFVLNEDPASIPVDTRSLPLRVLAVSHSDASRLNLKVESTEPAFQMYTGAGIDVPSWQGGEVNGVRFHGGPGFGAGSGFCIEPSRYVNASGKQEWRSMCLLKKGDTYGCRTRYWGWKN